MLKEFCSIATRYEKTDASHSAVRHLVGSAIASEECPHALVDFYNDGEEVKGAGFQDVQRRRSGPWRGCLRAPSRPSPLEAGWLRTRARTRSHLTSMSISIAAKVRARSAGDQCRPRPTMRPHRRNREDRGDGDGRPAPRTRR